MTPYYEREGIAIHLGDCLEILDALALDSVDAVVTDPPYASGTRKEAQKPSSGAMLRGERFGKTPIANDQMTTLGFVWLMRQAFSRIVPVLPRGGSILSFIDWRGWPNLCGALETLDLRIQTMIVWDKGSMGLGNGFRSRHELIAHASKGTPTVYDRGKANVLTHKRERPIDHPSPKPVPLMEDLLAVVSAPGQLIVDPFMGAGATLDACARIGRRAIGIELDERYAETAAKRVDAALDSPEPVF